ncbi:MAG: ribosomal-processing cysteine protease Prp [Clostridia bacterium]|nr:ribosomal-processing cysteine protease Prp [Clostridia bacterium]
MVDAVFYRNADFKIVGFSVSGHADYADHGKDIVCAAVSAMSSLVVNTLEEIFVYGGTLNVGKSGKLVYFLPDINPDEQKNGNMILDGFRLQLEEYSRTYPKNIKVRFDEAK